MNDSANDSLDGAPTCGYYEGYTLVRFIAIVTAIGVAVLGMANNALLVYLFSSKPKPSAPVLYLAVIACLDWLLCFVYIMVFGLDAVTYYLQIRWLYVVWHWYIIPVFILSRTVQLLIPYMLICATLERWIWLSETKLRPLRAMASNAGRICCTAFIFALCIGLRSPMIWSIYVESYTNCSDFFRTLEVAATSIYQNDLYYKFDVYAMGFLQVILPLIVLLALNLAIVCQLLATHDMHRTRSRLHLDGERVEANGAAAMLVRQTNKLLSSAHQRAASQIQSQLLQIKARTRNAIHTMLVIATSYLLCNALHLILVILEQTDAPILKTEDELGVTSSSFYIIYSDWVSILYMTASALRLMLYYLFNDDIHNDIRDLLGLYVEVVL